VKMMGVEGPSVSIYDGPEVHRILLSADVAIVEALTNLDGLLGREILFSGAPLAFAGMDGWPVRACAIEE